MPVTTVEEAYRYLHNRPRFQDSGAGAARFELERFQRCCEEMGHIHTKFPAVHVGGSNGKGSTCFILGSVYRQAGYKTGVYTSPHLISYTERFRVDGDEIKDEELLLFFRQHQEKIEKYSLSYFEISTAIAFWYFGYRKVDLAIIEVGLGGRLDATNIIQPMVSVITNITLDHTDLLGPTLEDIAGEKAGIIKKQTPVVIGNLPGEAERVITDHAKEKEASIHRAKDLKPAFDKGRFSIHPENESQTIHMRSGLTASIQKYNIAMAWQVKELINHRFPVTTDEFSRGVEKVSEYYPVYGRFERLTADRRWFFDGAHNPDAVRALKEMVSTIEEPSSSVLVLSMMTDKVNEEVMKLFSDFGKIFYYELSTPRAATYDAIRSHLKHVKPFPEEPERRNLLFEEFESELVIFAGSFYFYSTVRDWLNSFAKNR